MSGMVCIHGRTTRALEFRYMLSLRPQIAIFGDLSCLRDRSRKDGSCRTSCVRAKLLALKPTVDV
jgi:hypothetical protein